MAAPKLSSLRAEYNDLLNTCVIRSARLSEVQKICDKILKNQTRYESLGSDNGVPWYMVAVIHSLEGDLDFTTHLHNGDSLKRRTINDPAGRPPGGSPPFTFEESAKDALAFDRMNVGLEPSFAGICFKLEGFNGFGSRFKGIHTPYLWSFSNHYTAGKFVRDGVFSPTAVSEQCGAAVILRRLLEMKAVDFAEQKTPELRDDATIVYSKKKSTDPAVVERVTKFQELLNTQPGIFLRADGVPGDRTSEAVKAIFGHFLVGDPRASV
jgi:lysozyme family protein